MPISTAEQVRILTQNCDCDKGLQAPLLPESLRETDEERFQRFQESGLLDPDDLDEVGSEVASEEHLLPPSMRAADFEDEKQLTANRQQAANDWEHPATNSQHLLPPVMNFRPANAPGRTLQRVTNTKPDDNVLPLPTMDFAAYRRNQK